MTAYIIRRVLWLVPVLLFVSLVTFVLMHAVDGGPFDTGQRLTQTDRARLEARYGLDEPVWRQYLTFLSGTRCAATSGSRSSGRTQTVREIIWEGFKVRAVLGGLALALAAVVGVTLGGASAVNRNGLGDYAAVSSRPRAPLYRASSSAFSDPGVRGEAGQGACDRLGHAAAGRAAGRHAGALPTAYLARITRAALLEVLQQDYVRTARAKGLPSSAVLRATCCAMRWCRSSPSSAR